MAASLAVSILNRDGAAWDATITEVRTFLGGGENPLLFPHHYLVATFPKIGGEIVRFSGDGAILAFGFLFPRGLCEGGRRVYTLRYHAVVGDERDEGCYGRGGVADLVRHMLDDVGALVGGAKVVFYDPSRPHRFNPSSQRLPNGVDIGRPGEAEAAAIRDAQAAIWGAAQDGLYPPDLHSVGFGAGTTLVARRGGELIGFLFGFHRFAGSTLPPSWAARYGGELRLESQLLGVQAAARKGGIGFLLKCAQADDAREQQIGIVNWTVDPLQFSNAILNFGRLKAVAFDFYPEHYTFRNRLNQVAASRFGMTWLVSSKRVRLASRAERGKAIVDLRGDTTIPRLNRGGNDPCFGATAPTVAIEIPANWTAVQRDDRDLAIRWRTTTDQLFAHYLGHQPGRYMVTGVGQDDAACFLLAERVTPELLEAFGDPE